MASCPIPPRRWDPRRRWCPRSRTSPTRRILAGRPGLVPGGIASIVAWADGALRERGTPRIGPVRQVKTWNLSSVLQLPTAHGVVWCKSVPRFFAHEPASSPARARAGAHRPRCRRGRRRSLRCSLRTSGPRCCGTPTRNADPDGSMLLSPSKLTGRIGPTISLRSAAGSPLGRARGSAPAFLARGDVRATLRSDELGALDDLAADLPGRVATLAAWASRTRLCTATSTPGTGSGVTASCSCSTGVTASWATRSSIPGSWPRSRMRTFAAECARRGWKPGGSPSRLGS